MSFFFILVFVFFFFFATLRASPFLLVFCCCSTTVVVSLNEIANRWEHLVCRVRRNKRDPARGREQNVNATECHHLSIELNLTTNENRMRKSNKLSATFFVWMHQQDDNQIEYNLRENFCDKLKCCVDSVLCVFVCITEKHPPNVMLKASNVNEPRGRRREESDTFSIAVTPIWHFHCLTALRPRDPKHWHER